MLASPSRSTTNPGSSSRLRVGIDRARSGRWRAALVNGPNRTEAQVAYRLADEEVVRWRSALDAQLDRIRTTAMSLLAVAVLAAGNGLAGYPTGASSLRPSVLWVSVIGAGVLANLAAVLVVLRSPVAPFGDRPDEMVRCRDRWWQCRPT